MEMLRNCLHEMQIKVLKDIVEGADLSNILQLRNVCLYVLAHAGFFRSEEVLNIRVRHVHFHEGYMIIKVEKSKTDTPVNLFSAY